MGDSKITNINWQLNQRALIQEKSNDCRLGKVNKDIAIKHRELELSGKNLSEQLF